MVIEDENQMNNNASSIIKQIDDDNEIRQTRPAKLQRRETYTENIAHAIGMPSSITDPILVTYRSFGIGLFGAVMRYAGMPLEKIALFMNSSQVSGNAKCQFCTAAQLTFQDGLLAPYRVVGPASVIAWFLQYGIMGFAFQFFDHALSEFMGVEPVVYGKQLMEDPSITRRSSTDENPVSFEYQIKIMIKTLFAPVLSSTLESSVSNRAEVQRYYGIDKYKELLEKSTSSGSNSKVSLRRIIGPAFLPSVMRNIIMCNTSFVLTPITYRIYFPQQQKNPSSLFWYGLCMNVFIGNTVAITQQALWGRYLDAYYISNNISSNKGSSHPSQSYLKVIKDGYRKEGISAFFTTSKWMSRVLMNAPAQGVLPWFYNEVLPIGEKSVLNAFKIYIYKPIIANNR